MEIIYFPIVTQTFIYARFNISNMPSFWKHVNRVLKEAEIIIEVLDARMIRDTRNLELEAKVEKSGKILLYVVNKSDLVGKEEVERIKKKLHPCVFISSKEKLGTTILKKKLLEFSKGKGVVVGIVGYPNVGKSSLINALSGRGAAKTSSESGYTKGFQKIKVDNKIMVLDTPGVLPHREKDDDKHGKTGSLSYGKIKDIVTVVLRLIAECPDKIKLHYMVKGDDEEEILSAIAIKFKKLKAGGEPNLDVAGRLLLKDWQTGKIK
jgi:ribosome biogenesis GTPase A